MERGELVMAFTYAYGLDGSTPQALDFAITSAVPALGDLFLVASGIATTKATATTANTAKVAVSVGGNFRGLAQGGTYAATTVGIYQPPALTKLIVDPNAVYRIPWSASGTSATVGSTYNLANTTTTSDQTLNPAAVTAGRITFVLVENDTNVYPDAPNGYAYVTVASANRVVPA
jgi:hypothetical protein